MSLQKNGEGAAPAARRALCGVGAGDCVLTALLAFYAALYLELFGEAAAVSAGAAASGLIAGALTGSVVLHIALLFVVFTVIGVALARYFARLLHFVHAHRFVIAGVILLMCVLFEISGSSIGMWFYTIPGSESTGTLFGIPRAIRQDEWLVYTPFALSQSYDGYSGISEIIRGTATDVTMVYGQPSWALPTLFRPFLWGYLLLGSAKGLSFYWIGRVLALFLVTFECAKLYTKQDKAISAIVAVAVTFSPVMQWWFGAIEIAELFIFGQGVVLCLHYLFTSRTLRRKIACAALLAECIGGYLFVIYPAWQVPLFYVFAILSVFVVVRCVRKRRADGARTFRPEILCIVGAVAVSGCLVGLCLYQSMDTIKAVMGTVYPGARNETGGGAASMLFNYIPGLLSAIDANQWLPNVCEPSAMFSLFPMGLVLAVWALTRKRDRLLIVLAALEVFFLWYMCLGVPSVIAKATLLFEVPASRLIIAFGALDLAIVARSWTVLMHSDKPTCSRKLSLAIMVICAAVFAIAGTGVGILCHPELSAKLYLVMEVIAVFLCALFLLLAIARRDNADRNRFLACFAAVVMLNGLCINPVQHGASVVTENETVKMAESVASSDDGGLWIADNSAYSQALLVGGAPTINSVNVYPNLQRWSALDPYSQYVDIYNRYEHISVTPSSDETSFSLIASDSIMVTLNVDDLKKLDVLYWLSSLDLTGYNDDQVTFERIASTGDSTCIYKVHYAS